MTSTSCKIDLVCTIDGDEDLVFIRLDLSDGDKHITTLEYAEITAEYKQLVSINSELELFADAIELESSIINAHTLKFLGEKRDDPRLDLLLNVKMKMNHQEGLCGNNCILCNPDLGDDPFPDFAFDAKFLDPKGEA